MRPKGAEPRAVTPVLEDTPDEAHAKVAPEKIKSSPDPELEKKKREKERLLQELRGLESDVAQCVAVIDKLQDRPDTHALGPAEKDNIMYALK
jgi:hypothetical protein